MSQTEVIIDGIRDFHRREEITVWDLYCGEGRKYVYPFLVTSRVSTLLNGANGHDCLAYTIHAYGNKQGVCTFLVCDPEYPERPAKSLLFTMLDEFTALHSLSVIESAKPNSLPYPKLKEYIKSYQDPSEADNIMKIQKELDTTTVVMHQTIQSMLERGEKLDSLVQKSDTLSAQSKMFYTQVCSLSLSVGHGDIIC